MSNCLPKELNRSLIIVSKLLLMLILISCKSTGDDHSSSNLLPPTLTQRIEPTPNLTPSRIHDISTAIPSRTPPSTLESSPLLDLIKAELLATDCSPPCVFNIIPGQTKADEMPSILESLKEERVIRDYYFIKNPSATSYDALFSSYPLGIDIQIDEDENIVLAVGYGADARFITFGDIVERFGEPTFVLPVHTDRFESLILEYPDAYLRVQVRTDFLGDYHLPVSLDMTVNRLVYESPEVSHARLSSFNLAMWEGYKSFEYYYMVQDQLEGQESN